LIKKGANGSFAIGPGNTDKFQVPGRVTVKIGRHYRQRLIAISYFHIGNLVDKLPGHFLTNHCIGTRLYRLIYKSVAIGLSALYRNEDIIEPDSPRIETNGIDHLGRCTAHCRNAHPVQYVFQ
jgi:hypothetical protein